MKILLNSKVRDYIRERGIKFSHIADKLNISVQLFGLKLNGNVSVSVRELNTIWAMLMIPVKDLLTEEGYEAYEERLVEMEFLEQMEDAR